MGYGGRWKELLTRDTKLPGRPVVEIGGDDRVLIENHRGVCAYSRDLIRVRLSFGEAVVRGRELCLVRMTPQQLLIRGRLDGVELCRKGEGL